MLDTVLKGEEPDPKLIQSFLNTSGGSVKRISNVFGRVVKVSHGSQSNESLLLLLKSPYSGVGQKSLPHYFSNRMSRGISGKSETNTHCQTTATKF